MFLFLNTPYHSNPIAVCFSLLSILILQFLRAGDHAEIKCQTPTQNSSLVSSGPCVFFEMYYVHLNMISCISSHQSEGSENLKHTLVIR